MTDVETCYKAFRGEIIRNMTITSTGFGFEIEVTAKVAKLGVSIYEVPISYHGRTYEQGKKIGMKDGIAALWYIFAVQLSVQPKRFFPPSSGGRKHTARRQTEGTLAWCLRSSLQRRTMEMQVLRLRCRTLCSG